MKLFFKQINKNKLGRKTLSGAKGFTLVETLIAIGIFSLSLMAMMSTLASGIANTTFAKQKMTATYLAEEGIEYIRNMRDDYVLYPNNTLLVWDDPADVAFNSNHFVDNIIQCTVASSPLGCGFHDSLEAVKPKFIFKCSKSAPCKLQVENGSFSYDSSGGVNSDFTREIRAEINLMTPDEIKVTSTVKWGKNNSVSFSESLFNWTQ